MVSNKSLSVLLFSLLLNFHSVMSQNVIKGGYWFPASEFAVADIDASLFTHLFCAFADLNPQTNLLIIAPQNTNSFSTFTVTVQQRNPSVKTLLSIGGGNANPDDYASMASQPNSRKAFIDSSIKLARQYNFHGLDLDWEYPKTQSDMVNMGVLFNEWRAATVAESITSGKPLLLLSMAAAFSPRFNGLVYPAASITTNLDFINVMAYDLYGPSRATKLTTSHAILYSPSGDSSASSGIKQWIQDGLSPKKLVLGLPYYGYAWKLANPQNHGLGAAATGPASPGDPNDGSISYKGIKDFIASNNAPVVHDATLGLDYTFVGTTWIGYDDSQTINEKVTFAKKTGLGGFFAWHVANDLNWTLSKEAARAWQAGVVK